MFEQMFPREFEAVEGPKGGKGWAIKAGFGSSFQGLVAMEQAPRSVLNKVNIRGRGSGLAAFRKFFQLSRLAPYSVDNEERKARSKIQEYIFAITEQNAQASKW
ncbi:hypothetical protein FH972_020910 [Carpinus fangiana]|uniref:Uncharacterized protein n=1 Tax=Carpinus fangiana TaxID=176857 RepID=A0A5N6RUN3_9ROSI|nr:hypothetical protein FH972_020910 [Carpinus fangiana]